MNLLHHSEINNILHEHITTLIDKTFLSHISDLFTEKLLFCSELQV